MGRIVKKLGLWTWKCMEIFGMMVKNVAEMKDPDEPCVWCKFDQKRIKKK